MNINLTERERIFANYISDRGLMSRIYKNSKIQRVNQTNNTITNYKMGNGYEESVFKTRNTNE